jgi:hypothetical protein
MTPAELDPAISSSPSDDELARRLATAVPDLDEDLALEVIEALYSAETAPLYDDTFKRQLGHRLDQAQLASADD